MKGSQRTNNKCEKLTVVGKALTVPGTLENKKEKFYII
jgi:hypothetical protein